MEFRFQKEIVNISVFKTGGVGVHSSQCTVHGAMNRDEGRGMSAPAITHNAACGHITRKALHCPQPIISQTNQLK